MCPATNGYPGITLVALRLAMEIDAVQYHPRRAATNLAAHVVALLATPNKPVALSVQALVQLEAQAARSHI